MTLMIDLAEEDLTALNARASEQGISAEQFAQELLKQALAPSSDPRPLPVRIRELWADLPDTDSAGIPSDGATQHDHYIYGTPKREQ